MHANLTLVNSKTTQKYIDELKLKKNINIREVSIILMFLKGPVNIFQNYQCTGVTGREMKIAFLDFLKK